MIEKIGRKRAESNERTEYWDIAASMSLTRRFNTHCVTNWHKTVTRSYAISAKKQPKPAVNNPIWSNSDMDKYNS